MRASRSWWGAGGILALLLVWELLGRTVMADSRSVPPPSEVLASIREDGWDFYGPNIATTLGEAGWGWLWGNAIAIVLALVFVQVPLVERGLMRVAIAAYCLPIIAIGPILQILFAGATPKIVLSALACFFATLIGAVAGLRSADRTSLDLVAAYGGSSLVQLHKVRTRASLPSLFAGLRLAAPAALLGAIVGEYLGGDSGLGVAMIHSQQAFDVPRTWALATVMAALAGAGYAITALVGRRLTPWASRVDR